MKKLLKAFLYLLLVLLIITTVFFFWASSSQLSKEQYTTISTYNAQSAPAKDSVYTIVAYNVGYLSGLTNNKPVDREKKLFDDNLAKVATAFNEIDPDIIAFQEIDYNSKRSYNINQQEAIAANKFPFGAEVVNWDKKYVPFPQFPISKQFGRMLSGQSILSKFPIKDQERIELERVESNPFWHDAFYLDRLAQVTTVEIEGREVIIINVHLEAFDKPTRLKQSEAIVGLFHKYAKQYPTILLGDFNSDYTHEEPTIKTIFNIYGVANAVPNLSAKTFPSVNPQKRLDYIFYTPKFFQKIDARIVTEVGDASDHLPVLMKFKLK